MMFGISLNVNDPVSETLAKGMSAERLGLDYVWAADLPSQRYAPVVAAVVASATHEIRVGLGLISPFLHTPQQIASSLTTLAESYGSRFDVCIGPGDRDELLRVGVDLDAVRGISQHVLNARREIHKLLKERGLECRIWLGAQGPAILRIAPAFDGVLLNYSSPTMLRWALEVIRAAKDGIPNLLGVFAPSYVYGDFDPNIHRMLQFASATVALGTSDYVLRRFSLLESLQPARKELLCRTFDSSILRLVPPDIIEKFGIFKSHDELSAYVDELKRLGIEHVVFSHPQGHSIETIKELATALRQIGA